MARVWPLLATLLAASVSAAPQSASIDAEVASAQGLIEAGDLDGAARVLDGAVRRLEKDPARKGDLALAHLWSGAVYVLRNEPQAARGHFREAIRTRPPGPRFVEGTVPPKVVRAYEEVLKQMATGDEVPAVLPDLGGSGPGVLVPLPPSDCCPEVFLPPGTRQVVVSGAGGDFTSIAAALRSAPSVRIVLRPGVYRESLVIDRPVAIVGDGSRDAIVIQASAGAAVTARTRYALIEGITLRVESAPGARSFAVEALEGTLWLRNSELSSDTLSAVSVRGPARVSLEGCRVAGAKEDGVLVHDGGHLVMSDTQVEGAGLAGVEVRGQSDAEIRSSKLLRSGAGLLFQQGGRGEVEDCDLVGNEHGVDVLSGAAPNLRKSRIVDSGTAGVLVEGGAVLLEDDQVRGSRLIGVIVRGGGSATIRRCTVTAHRAFGIDVSAGASAVIEGCDLTGNRVGAVKTWRGSKVTRSGNRE